MKAVNIANSQRVTMSAMLPYLIALRPRHWVKNLIIFAAPLFAFKINPGTVLASLFTFVIFCLASSGFYLINDLVDLESDRQHPSKRLRPIASGVISAPAALGMAMTIWGIVLICSWAQSRGVAAVVVSYGLLQVAYNIRLKRMVILDVMAIATGFVLRAFAGAVATGIMLSPWFLLCLALLALFLAVEKRKAELLVLQSTAIENRGVGYRYPISLLARMENIVATGAIVTYAIWSSGPQVTGASTPWMLFTLPFVLYGIFRYQLLSVPKEVAHDKHSGQEAGGDAERPEEIFLRDVPTLVTVLSWLLVTFTILLLKHRGYIN